MAMRTKHFPKEDKSTKVVKHQVSYKSAKCCPPGLRREDRRRVTAEESGGECLTAKRTVKAEGRNLSACGAGRDGAFLFHASKEVPGQARQDSRSSKPKGGGK